MENPDQINTKEINTKKIIDKIDKVSKFNQNISIVQKYYK